MKLWSGRFQKDLDQRISDFNSSIEIDSRMYSEDIEGSIAHVTMLGQCSIITKSEAERICDELEKIKTEIDKNILVIDPKAEDIHTFIEQEITKRLGDMGKKLHTARSRNDQVSLDLRLYLSNQSDIITEKLKNLIHVICDKAIVNTKTLMPGYTHLQRAQPVSFAHHIMAYTEMFLRDINRINDAKDRMQEMPLGSGALASTTYPINRSVTTLLLGWDKMTNNSMDAVSDRDFCIELASALSILMMHLSRFCEEIILWSSWEFKFVELDDSFSTGSSIMPQKKNPDIAELIRAKSGRVYGNLMSLLTMMKALPLSYNKDLQEDKEAIFNSIDTALECIDAFTPMFETLKLMPENMRKAAESGFINATDCADYLVKKGLAFRDAYQIVGEIVLFCINNNYTLESLPIDKYKSYSSKFDEDIFEAISLENCLEERASLGGPAEYNVLEQIKRVRELLENK